MCSLLYYISMIQNKYMIRVSDRGKSVRDYEAGPSLHQARHRLLYQRFRSGI